MYVPGIGQWLQSLLINILLFLLKSFLKQSSSLSNKLVIYEQHSFIVWQQKAEIWSENEIKEMSAYI